MKNKIIITMVLLLSLQKVNAQISAGANLGFFKTTAEGSDAQLGFNLVGKYEINDQIRVGLNFGYYFKNYEVMGLKSRSFTMPITALFEYSFSDNEFSPYAGIDIGAYRFGASFNGTTTANGNLGLAPVIGFNYELSDNFFINTNIKYHYILTDVKSTSAYGLNAGILFKF